ncbi:MAG: hypothetical protein ABSG63_04670 [Spirochaetia bacterium]|jgi:hypothetical protein
MKMRKILPLVLLAVGSVFLLSSCDAMLDAIFSNNTVNVYMSEYIPSWGYSPSDTMTVTFVGPTSVTATAGYSGRDFYYAYWAISIPKLADGTYTVQAAYYHPGVGSPPYITYQVMGLSLPASTGSPHNVNVVFPSF